MYQLICKINSLSLLFFFHSDQLVQKLWVKLINYLSTFFAVYYWSWATFFSLLIPWIFFAHCWHIQMWHCFQHYFFTQIYMWTQTLVLDVMYIDLTTIWREYCASNLWWFILFNTFTHKNITRESTCHHMNFPGRLI